MSTFSFLALAAALGTQGTPARVRIDPGFELAGHRVVDADSDGRAEILAIGRDGRVRTFAPYAPEAKPGELTLPTPERTLLALTKAAGTGYLLALSPAGALAYPIEPGGVVAAQPQVWVSRARFALRVGAPTFSGIAQDVNNDGLDDLVVPTLSGVELWLASLAPDAKVPTFRKAATVSVEIGRWGSHDAEYLSDSLESSFTVPGLATRDVNGDGRPDLLVEQGQRRAFHLQREDGSFPVEPDVSVDLSIFRDTTEATGFQLGGTLSSGDKASWSSRDIDGDTIPDYVIGHRRKVWVFRGSKAGPQFTQPSAILKTAEDITVLFVHPLDSDTLPDLLLVKVQIPTLATILRGLFSEWDIRVRVLAYSNIGEGRFESSPSLSNELSMRLPGIIGLAKNPEKLLDRFADLEKQVRPSARGDIDGDGVEDVLLQSSDEQRIEAWIGSSSSDSTARTGERKIRTLLFDESDAVWDIDRLLATMGGLAQRRNTLLTGGREPDRTLALADPATTDLVALECADFGGETGEELVAAFKLKGQPRSGWFEVLSFREAGR